MTGAPCWIRKVREQLQNFLVGFAAFVRRTSTPSAYLTLRVRLETFTVLVLFAHRCGARDHEVAPVTLSRTRFTLLCRLPDKPSSGRADLPARYCFSMRPQESPPVVAPRQIAAFNGLGQSWQFKMGIRQTAGVQGVFVPWPAGKAFRNEPIAFDGHHSTIDLIGG